jgi:NAD(P)H-dependent FMN reductase/ketosteroid isomerase-like protein
MPTDASFKIAVIVGSLRKESWTRKFARAAIGLSPPSLTCRIVEIGELPLYNEDLDGEKPPKAWTDFRNEIGDADGVLFATPEYNRSMPACLKNALDVGSRPAGKNHWDGMPAAIISVTPYKLGAFGANHALRQALVFTNLPVMQQPEAYIGDVAHLMNAGGKIAHDDTNKFLKKFMAAFSDWVALIHSRPGSPNFAAFLAGDREAAASAYVRGDSKPLDQMVLNEGDATFFHPGGDIVTGAPSVKARYDKDAAVFSADGRSTVKVLQAGSAGDLAFWCGTQTADVSLKGNKQHMVLRITEVFRHINGGWKLVHRHAEPQIS